MRILLITPFPAERLALEALLREDGHEVTAMTSRADGVAWATAHQPDAIIADAQVPGIDGLALVRELRDIGPISLLLLCPRSNRVLCQPGVACLTKPIDLAELHRYLQTAGGAPRETSLRVVEAHVA
jgi:two-component system, response regulator, stage 0 sporulation protein F